MIDLKFNDVVLILATLAGPILAVQAQKWLDRARETRKGRLTIFQTLMATRSKQLSAEHVAALNMIEMAFSGRWQSRKWRSVVDAYRIYFDRLNTDLGETPEQDVVQRWRERCDDLFVDLLFAMSAALGFNFDRVQLRRGVYHPRAFNENEAAERLLRDNLIRVLVGQQPLAMRVVAFPFGEGNSSPESEEYQHKGSQKEETGPQGVNQAK